MWTAIDFQGNLLVDLFQQPPYQWMQFLHEHFGLGRPSRRMRHSRCFR